MSKRDAPLPPFGELELAALEHLWSERESDVASTHAAVGAPRSITLNTVGSALERLHRKGFVARWKVGHAYWYRPAVDRDAFYARRMVEAAGGARQLAGSGLLAAFVDVVAQVDERTLDRLEALIRRRKAES